MKSYPPLTMTVMMIMKVINMASLHDQFQGGVVSVPFVWENVLTGRRYNMHLYAGFMVVSQDPESKALRPEIGWAVADQEEVEKAIEEKSKRHY